MLVLLKAWLYPHASLALGAGRALICALTSSSCTPADSCTRKLNEAGGARFFGEIGLVLIDEVMCVLGLGCWPGLVLMFSFRVTGCGVQPKPLTPLDAGRVLGWTVQAALPPPDALDDGRAPWDTFKWFEALAEQELVA